MLQEAHDRIDVLDIPPPLSEIAAAIDVATEIDDDDLCDLLLAALVAMASKSKRRQADLAAAMLRSRIEASQPRVDIALARLQEGGCIREIVPLYDGGILITVTNMGMDLLGRSAHWRFLQDLRRVRV